MKLTGVEVQESQIQVTWQFTSGDDVNRSRRAAGDEDENYRVGVQIQYKKESEAEYSVYPADGSKLPARLVTVFDWFLGRTAST